jgi:hypothetical protein
MMTILQHSDNILTRIPSLDPHFKIPGYQVPEGTREEEKPQECNSHVITCPPSVIMSNIINKSKVKQHRTSRRRRREFRKSRKAVKSSKSPEPTKEAEPLPKKRRKRTVLPVCVFTTRLLGCKRSAGLWWKRFKQSKKATRKDPGAWEEVISFTYVSSEER